VKLFIIPPTIVKAISIITSAFQFSQFYTSTFSPIITHAPGKPKTVTHF